MNKYIDADKLIAEIERRIGVCEKQRSDAIDVECYSLADDASARMGELHVILETITSLQQEQPEPSNNLVDVDAVREDFIAEVYRVLDADSTNDRANAIIDAFDSLPTVSQEQPELCKGWVARNRPNTYAEKLIAEIETEKLIAEIECEQEQDWEKILEYAHNKEWL